MDKTLKTFYDNENQRGVVKAFMIQVLQEKAVKKTFDRKDTSGIADAKECIDEMFNKLDELFGKQKPVDIKNSR